MKNVVLETKQTYKQDLFLEYMYIVIITFITNKHTGQQTKKATTMAVFNSLVQKYLSP